MTAHVRACTLQETGFYLRPSANAGVLRERVWKMRRDHTHEIIMAFLPLRHTNSPGNYRSSPDIDSPRACHDTCKLDLHSVRTPIRTDFSIDNHCEPIRDDLVDITNATSADDHLRISHREVSVPALLHFALECLLPSLTPSKLHILARISSAFG